ASGYLYAVWANNRWTIPLRDSIDAPIKNIQSQAAQEDRHLPSIWFSLLPILIPTVAITADAVLDTMGTDWSQSILLHTLVGAIQFMGEKNIALIAGGLAALIMLAVQKDRNKQGVLSAVQAALMSGGIIILITAAGGAFGGMLQQTGISARIVDLTQGFQMALIPLAFLVTAVVRTAQGSATVAMITASGILSGMASSPFLEYHPIYIG